MRPSGSVIVCASKRPITGMVTTLLYQPTPPNQGWVTGASITRPATRSGKSCAMQQQDRRTRGVARPQFDHIQRRAGDIDLPSLRWIEPFEHKNAGLCDQRQHRQPRHDENWNHWDFPGHPTITQPWRGGFASNMWSFPL